MQLIVNLVSSQLDSNQLLWWDSGFVGTDWQPHLKECFDKPHMDTVAEKKRILKNWQRGKHRSVRSCGFSLATGLTLLFYCHLVKRASTLFCPKVGISVYCVSLAYLHLTTCSEHFKRYNKIWLSHPSFFHCSTPRNLMYYSQHIFSGPVCLFFD